MTELSGLAGAEDEGETTNGPSSAGGTEVARSSWDSMGSGVSNGSDRAPSSCSGSGATASCSATATPGLPSCRANPPGPESRECPQIVWLYMMSGEMPREHYPASVHPRYSRAQRSSIQSRTPSLSLTCGSTFNSVPTSPMCFTLGAVAIKGQ